MKRLEAAVASARSFPAGQLSSAQLLQLYGLFKQSSGAVPSDVVAPSRLNVTGRAKWDAWRAVRHLSPEEASAQYCDLVEALVEAYGGAAGHASAASRASARVADGAASAAGVEVEAVRSSSGGVCKPK